ncbi:hypothetical protein BKA63DRAFT_106363 [Paraphoma chrysanthemicola]|nr:hypothetical protein BKA63DRAFT_106363 [Paraphoma chrysanthemicola]
MLQSGTREIGTLHESSERMSYNWSVMKPPDERKKVQNKLAQRSFRDKVTQQKGKVDREAENQRWVGSAHALASNHQPGSATLSRRTSIDLADLTSIRAMSSAIASIDDSPRSNEANTSITKWINGAEAAESLPASAQSAPDVSASISTSPILSAQSPLRASSPTVPRKLLIELLDVLYTQGLNDAESVHGQIDFDCLSTARSPGDASTPGDAENGNGTESSSNSSPKPGNSSRSSQSQKRSYQPDRDSPSEQDNDDKPPSKRPNCGPDPMLLDDKTSPANELLMPCPLLESQNCLGTNPTISELLRCLATNHQITICVECCTLLDEAPGGKKPEEVLKEHRSSTNCVRRCISKLCAGNIGIYHKRTPKCPSQRKMANELWRFIWTLVNPGKEAPVVQFGTGIGYLHDKVRSPRTKRANDRSKRNRAQEIVQEIEEDLEAKERRIQVLENEVKAANDNLNQTQRVHELRLLQSQQDHAHSLNNCMQKISEQDEIILDLLERLVKSGRSFEPSLQRRLKRVCPSVYQEAIDGAKALPPTIPPSPESNPQKRPSITPSQSPPLQKTSSHDTYSSCGNGLYANPRRPSLRQVPLSSQQAYDLTAQSMSDHLLDNVGSTLDIRSNYYSEADVDPLDNDADWQAFQQHRSLSGADMMMPWELPNSSFSY